MSVISHSSVGTFWQLDCCFAWLQQSHESTRCNFSTNSGFWNRLKWLLH